MCVVYTAPLGGSWLTAVFPEMVQEVKLTVAPSSMYKPPPCMVAWEQAYATGGVGDGRGREEGGGLRSMHARTAVDRGCKRSKMRC